MSKVTKSNASATRTAGIKTGNPASHNSPDGAVRGVDFIRAPSFLGASESRDAKGNLKHPAPKDRVFRTANPTRAELDALGRQRKGK